MKTRCLGCMEEYDNDYGLCPVCGYEPDTSVESPIHMQPGVLLHGQYLIGRVLGFGGFGVTYIGWDFKLERKVAIKEYLPSEFATRLVGQTQVSVFGGKREEQFGDGMEQFVQEARRLAQFQNEEGIVQIYDSFAENNTAYIIMEYLDGETLTADLERNGKIAPDQAIEMITPVLRSLETVHKAGIIHRDIAPDNIFLTKDGKVKLIDFGAARYATTTHSRSLTVIIKPGYSPEEQYRSRGDQGPHTDVYALGAVLYRMVTGIVLPDSMERRANFERNGKSIVVPISKNCKISRNQENAIMNALNVRVEDRTPTAAQFLEELTAQRAVKRILGKIKITDLMRWPLWAKILVPVAGTAAAALLFLLLTGRINPNGNILTDIALAEAEARVPGIINYTLDVGENRLAERDLNCRINGAEYSDVLPANMILYQSLSAGQVVEKGSAVEVYVSTNQGSTGLEPGVMPNLVYKTFAEAETMMASLGLTIKAEEVYDDRVAEGLVVAQNLVPGSSIGTSGEVKVEVSKGVDPNKQVGTPELVVLSRDSYELYAGDSVTLRAEGGNGKYDYKSSDEAIVNVDRQGKVTAKGIGTATITVSSGDAKEAVCTVEVRDYEMALNREELTLFKDASASLMVMGIPANAQISWTSANSEIATVDQNGKITGVNTGETEITASWKNADSGQTYSASVKVIVEEQGITLNLYKITGFYVGETKQITDQYSTDVTKLTWTSRNEKVATVDETGLITAVGGGSATVTASFGEYAESCEVTVTQPGITFPKDKVSLYAGNTTTLSYSTTPSGAQVTWSSDNTNVATVKDGKVKTHSPGTAKIHAKMTYAGKTYEAICTISAGSPSITLNQSSITLDPNGSKTLTATTKPSSDVTWSSDNTGIAKVSGGKVTAVSAGSTTIRAKMTYGGKTYEATCKVTVSSPSISLNQSSITLAPNASQTLKATTKPSGASVTWSSDNTGIAKVSGGKVTAVGTGSTTIRAKITYGGKNYEATCKVTVTNPSIKLDKSSVSLMPGGSAKLTATVVPSGTSVSWSSSNTSVATVSGGTVKGVASGSATITAKMTYGGKEYKATCTVTVEKPSISLSSNSSTIEYSQRDKGTVTITANVKPDAGGTVKWSISDESVASLSANDKTVKVTAKSSGTATITATYTVNGTTVKDTCEITVKKAASTLKVWNVSYPKRGTVDEFTFQADASSNYQLTKCVIHGTATSNATGWSVSDTVTVTFVDGVYTLGPDQCHAITREIVAKYRSWYNLYVNVAGALGADDSLTMTVDGTLYDSSGATVSMAITYILDE